MALADNVLGLSRREVKLVDRVHDVEDENRRLKHHLSISQNQLIALLGEQQKNELEVKRKNVDEDYDEGGGEEGHKQPCSHHAERGLPKCEVIHIAIVSVLRI